MSHDATARCSDCGEKERSEMPSSGGLLNATSFEISPVVLFAAEELELAPLPKRPDIVSRGQERCKGRRVRALREAKIFGARC